MVGEGFSIGDKSSIKKSVIGKHCKIGNNVKIVNCVVHNHVTVEVRTALPFARPRASGPAACAQHARPRALALARASAAAACICWCEQEPCVCV